MSESLQSTIVPTGEATALLPVAGGRMKPVTVIGLPTVAPGGGDVMTMTWPAAGVSQPVP